MIQRALGAKSHGEAVLLAAMYSFYNDTDSRELWRLAGMHTVGDLSILDYERRQVIADLIVNYSGW